MEQLLNALKNRGLNAKLENTGGNVMVAFIEAGQKIIGVDEWTVCLYDSQMQYEECLFAFDDEEQNEEIRLLNLVNFASQIYSEVK